MLTNAVMQTGFLLTTRNHVYNTTVLNAMLPWFHIEKSLSTMA